MGSFLERLQVEWVLGLYITKKFGHPVVKVCAFLRKELGPYSAGWKGSLRQTSIIHTVYTYSIQFINSPARSRSSRRYSLRCLPGLCVVYDQGISASDYTVDILFLSVIRLPPLSCLPHNL
jgi:hypothetical protein